MNGLEDVRVLVKDLGNMEELPSLLYYWVSETYNREILANIEEFPAFKHGELLSLMHSEFGTPNALYCILRTGVNLGGTPEPVDCYAVMGWNGETKYLELNAIKQDEEGDTVIGEPLILSGDFDGLFFDQLVIGFNEAILEELKEENVEENDLPEELDEDDTADVEEELSSEEL